MGRLPTGLLVILSLGVAIALTLVSLLYVRESGEVVLWCDDEAACLGPRLAAGLPLPYVYDEVGVSIEHSVGVEDEIRWLPFVLNVGIYAAVLLGAFGVLGRARPGSRPPSG